MTNIVAVSDWQRGKLYENYNIEGGKIKVIGNAVNVDLFDSIKQEKFKHKVIYTSGPDRGLWNLFNIWDDLKKINPKLTLWVAQPPYTDDWDILDRIKKDYPNIEDLDVRFLGSLNPNDLYRQIKSSEYWICLLYTSPSPRD